MLWREELSDEAQRCSFREWSHFAPASGLWEHQRFSCLFIMSSQTWAQTLSDPCFGILVQSLFAVDLKSFYFIFPASSEILNSCVHCWPSSLKFILNTFLLNNFFFESDVWLCISIYNSQALCCSIFGSLFDNLKFFTSGAFILLFASGNHF